MIRVTLYLFIFVEFSIASFFYKQTYSLTHRDGSYFGFSLEYQNEKKRLIVGIPCEDRDGQLYSYPLETLDTSKAITPMISPKIINSILGNSDRSGSPEQHFWLGASVAATKDYVFTCAPLVTENLVVNGTRGESKKLFKACGTCLIIHDVENVTRFTGLYEQYTYFQINIDIMSIIGGVGWDMLMDDTNDVLLLSKPAFTSKIMYTSVKDPMRPVVSVNFTKEMQEKQYKGLKMAACNFFSDYKTVYAFTMQNQDQNGIIYFLHVDKNMKVVVMQIKNKAIQVKSKKIGIGFGAALNSADLNNDGYSELLVGAPLQAEVNGFNAGAVYIYVGGLLAKMILRSKSNNLNVICISHRQDGSHFGSAIASLDLDGDNLPEVFVSAPFEEGGGSVYVISGYEINKLLKARQNTFVTDIPSHQRINSKLQAFGYSVKPIADYDGAGGNYLVIGAPLSSAVEIYRSIPTITVTVLAYLKGEMVRELDENFKVTVKVEVQYPLKLKEITGDLLVTTSIGDGVSAVISSGKSYTIKLLRQQTTYTNDVVVTLDDQRPGFYHFTATVAAKPQKDSAEYSVRLSEHSITEKELQIVRKCNGDECVPRLSISDVIWSGSDTYMLGSSSMETVTVIIKNDGNTSYESCAKMKIIGAQVKDSECVEDGDSLYTCTFFELEREESKLLQVQLDMTRSSSIDDKLQVDVVLYNKCSSTDQKFTDSANKTLTVMYVLDTSNININKYASDSNVFDQEIADLTNSETIDVHEKYKITNHGSVRWENIRAVLSLKRRSFIESYLILVQESSDCEESEDKDNFVYKCTVTVEKQSEVYILTTINVFKDKIVDNLQDDKLKIVSELFLHLDPTPATKHLKSITTVTYTKDLGFGQNKSYVLVIATLAAIFIIFIIGIILYKSGFFKRTEKEKLKELKARVSQDAGAHRVSNQSLLTSEEILDEQAENTVDEYELTDVHKEE